MLSFLRRGQRWLTAIIVAGVGVVFAFFIGLGGPLQGPSAGSLIEVGPYRFGIREFERAREERERVFQQIAGEDFDARRFSDQLDDATARVLVDRAVLALEARDLGLAVPRKEIESLVVQSGGFRDDDGNFDPELFRLFVERNWGSERGFLEEQRLVSLASKMVQLIQTLPRVTDAEARESLRLRLGEVRLAFVVLSPAEIGADAEIAPEAVTAFLAEREDEARALYDTRSEVYDVPEQIRASHVLIRVPDDADEDTVDRLRGQAEAVRERIQGGEDFAVVAAEESEDPSKDAGGDLGFFGRGQMVPPFEEAAFALQPGELSEVVRTPFGFHVIRLDERREARFQPFEDVGKELATELLRAERGREEGRAIAERLAEAIRGGASLEDAARAEELTLERSTALRRRPDGFVPGVGASRETLAAAFALEAGESSPEIFEVSERYVMIQALERTDPSEEEIEGLLEEERGRLLTAKRNAMSEAWLADRRKRLLDEGAIQVDLAAIQR